MAYKVKNEIGNIELNRKVIEYVCLRVINSFGGDLIPSDSKGRIKKPQFQGKYGEESGFVRGRYNGELMDLDIYLVIKFGISMKETAAEFAEVLRKEMPAATGIEIGVIKVLFVGTLADKLLKREIEFKYERIPA